MVLIDLHTHTSASDGVLTPYELIDRALEAGIDLLAITDHDCVGGYRTALEYYTTKPSAMKLVSGIEYSCRWSGTTIHILGLGMDCDHPAMLEGVKKLSAARLERAEKISQRLAKKGFHGALAGAVEVADGSQLGRPHFAAWMVDQGHVADFSEAFDRYLGQGKIGDVKAFWPDMSEVTGWIADAGGVAVIAHPIHYKFTRMKLRRLVVDFKAAGGGGIELISAQHHQDHQDQQAMIRGLAREFELEVSAGSDFHRDTTYGPRLGVKAPKLSDNKAIWDRWISPEADSASALVEGA
jgi:3',5'-nucleoside bisphosphate phosphatase